MTIKDRVNKFASMALFFVLLLNIVIIPQVVEAEEREIAINSTEDFIKLSKDCKTDSYSRGKTFSLKNDLDFSQVEFTPIPIFTGIFKGNGYSISGIKYEGKSSNQGLFRVLEEGAVIENLNIAINMQTQGEQSSIGGLVAINKGTIDSCTVSGYVSGHTDVGAIAGVNSQTGKIINSTSQGQVKGKNQTGGITGTNKGLIKNSNNSGSINIEPEEWAINTGGIAGKNEGSIKNSINSGNVGYPRTGYNTGGIAGILIGYIEDCSNKGIINGRRDVGGIVGQLDTNFRIESTINYMEDLSKNINTLTASLSELAKSAEGVSSSSAEQLKEVVKNTELLLKNLNDKVKESTSNSNLFEEIKGEREIITKELKTIEELLKDSNLNTEEIKNTLNEINNILNDLENGTIVDYISTIKELNKLLNKLIDELPQLELIKDSIDKISKAIDSMMIKAEDNITEGIKDTTEIIDSFSRNFEGTMTETKALIGLIPEAVEGLTKNFHKVNESFSSIGTTINKIAQGPREVREDLSQLIEEEADGSILKCFNYGDIRADYNSGGILGSVQKENLLDPEAEEDMKVADYIFGETKIYIKATIYGCNNIGNISTKYNFSGGILGRGMEGAVINCTSTGIIEADKDYAGGIAGGFQGIILKSYTSGHIKGNNYIGGIAGQIKDIKDTIAIAKIEGKEAFIGSIAGKVEGEISGNLFALNEIGGIDGINYAGKAEDITYEELLALNNCPDIFKKLEVKFVAEDGSVVEAIQVPYGGAIAQLPEIENKEGKYWVWEDFDKENITYNQTIKGYYKKPITVLSTKEEIPMFLAEGVFYPHQELQVRKLSTEEIDKKYKGIVGAYEVQVTEKVGALKLHLKADEKVKVYKKDNEEWKEVITQRDGSYLVFEIDNGTQLLTTQNSETPSIFTYAIIILLIIAGICTLIYYKKKQEKK